MENAEEKANLEATDIPKKAHDLLFKTLVKRPHLARELLEAKTPTAILKILRLETLRLSDTSYVTPELSEDLADVVLLCDTDEGETIAICFILEHKSYVPAWPPFQIMTYQHHAWSRQLADKDGKPAPVVPVLFYHGREKWKPRPWKDYLNGWQEAFEPFTPMGHSIFIDLSEIPDEEIKRFRSGFLCTSLLLMKHRFEREYLLENLQEVFIFVEEDDEEADLDQRINNLTSVLRYLQCLQTVIKWEESKSLLHSLTLTNQVMDVLEIIKLESYQEGIEKGIEKGREKGREEEKFIAARNMLKLNFAPEIIAGVLEASIHYVLGIQRQIQSEPEIIALLEAGKLELISISEQLAVSPHLVKAVKREFDKKKAAH